MGLWGDHLNVLKCILHFFLTWEFFLLFMIYFLRCLKLFLIGEIDRRGDDCPQKADVLYSQIPRGGSIPRHGQPRGEATEAVRRQRGERKTWARACVVVHKGRSG